MANRLRFRVKDIVLGEEMDLDNVDLMLLAEFASQVATFLRGSEKTSLSDVQTSIKSGSLVLEASNDTGVLDQAFHDYDLATRLGLTESIDYTRMTVIEQWQKAASRRPDREYSIASLDKHGSMLKTLTINSKTSFIRKKSEWIPIEKYVYGRVFDLGGKNTPNVHFELEDGETIKVGTDAAILSEDRENRLYRKQLARVKALYNVDTHETKGERLISFEKYAPHYDEGAFDKIVKKSRVAWRSIKDPNRWLEELRGNV